MEKETSTNTPMVVITDSHAAIIFKEVANKVKEKVSIVTNMVIEDETDIGKALNITKELKGIGKQIEAIVKEKKAPYKESIDTLTAAGKTFLTVIEEAAKQAQERILAKQKELQEAEAKRQRQKQAEEDEKNKALKLITDRLQQEQEKILNAILSCDTIDELRSAAKWVEDLKTDKTYDDVNDLRLEIVKKIVGIGKIRNAQIKAGNAKKQDDIEKQVEEYKQAVTSKIAETVTEKQKESDESIAALQPTQGAKKLTVRKIWAFEVVNESEVPKMFLSVDKDKVLTWLKEVANSSDNPDEHLVPEEKDGVIYRGIRFYKKEIPVL